MVKGKSTTRLQLELPERSMQRLRDMKERTESTSYVDVVKDALRLYEALLKEVGAGSEILLRTPSGEVGRVFVPGLGRVFKLT